MFLIKDFIGSILGFRCKGISIKRLHDMCASWFRWRRKSGCVEAFTILFIVFICKCKPRMSISCSSHKDLLIVLVPNCKVDRIFIFFIDDDFVVRCVDEVL